MKKTGILHSLPFKLLVALAVGIVAGLALNAADGTAIGTALLNIIVTVKYIAGQFNFILCSADYHWIYRSVDYPAGQQCIPYADRCAVHCVPLFDRCRILRDGSRLHDPAASEYQP